MVCAAAGCTNPAIVDEPDREQYFCEAHVKGARELYWKYKDCQQCGANLAAFFNLQTRSGKFTFVTPETFAYVGRLHQHVELRRLYTSLYSKTVCPYHVAYEESILIEIRKFQNDPNVIELPSIEYLNRVVTASKERRDAYWRRKSRIQATLEARLNKYKLL